MWEKKVVLLVILIMEGLPLALGDIIEVNSDITTNQIWTADNTYRITETIGVEALLVIEPGTTVKYAFDKSLIVDNGGVLFSCGTPDNPIIYTYDSDPQNGAYCAIFIDETASASTKITYSFIEYAYIGIWIMNNRLDSPIENNYLYNNSTGILEYGIEHTDVYNNLIYASYYSGIEINMESYEGQASADSHILIQNNTCDYSQYDGIVVLGVDDDANAGEVELINNIVSGSSQYGLVLANGWMYFTVANTGYYDNIADKNWDFEEYNPVIETTPPYVEGTGTLPVCYLSPNSVFVNASDEYIEQTRLIGKTTDINDFPDSNHTDLGFHYPNWDYSNAGETSLYADFDNNFRVDYNDLSAFADYWLYDYNYNYQCWWWDWFENGLIDFNDLDVIMEHWLNPYDFSDFADFAEYWRKHVDYRFGDRRFDLVVDNIVDFRDFSKFAEQWGQETTSSDPNIQIQISGDPNNGYVDIGVSGYAPDTQCIFLFANGRYIGEIFGFEDGDTIFLDISELSNGEQQLKLVSSDSNSHITCSNITFIAFQCPLNYCFLPSVYEPNRPLYFSAIYNGAEDVTVKAYADGGNLVWSQAYTEDSVFDAIPAEITRQHDFDYISFDANTEELLDLNGEDSIVKVTASKDPNLRNTRALIITPDLLLKVRDCRLIAKVKKAFKDRGIIYEELFGQYATYAELYRYGRKGHIKYIYIDAHGNYRLKKVLLIDTWILRTVVKLYDGPVVSMRRSDFPPGQAPDWCENLDYWEKRTKSFYSMGFTDLELVYSEACYGGHLKINQDNDLVEGQPGQVGIFDGPSSDMTIALGLHEPSRSRFYQAWYNKSLIFLPYLETEYQDWSLLEWDELGNGESLYWAIQHVIEQQTDFGPNAPANNYRLKGQGFYMDIILNP